MNFLAHQYLSFEVEPVMVGNFIADTIRGNKNKFQAGVELGIEVHKRIDTFTDAHELVLETRKLLYPYFGKYAGVVQDVFYDHFLAINWKDYHISNFPEYCQNIYTTLNKERSIMNERAQRILFYMEKQNWLVSYQTVEGIDQAMNGLSRRAKFDSKMENSIPALLEHFDEMEKHFKAFFPELKNEVISNFSNQIAALSHK